MAVEPLKRGALETWLVQLRHRIFCIDIIEM